MKQKPTQAEIDAFIQERHDRRMPGNARLRHERAAELFRAAVQQAKKRKRKP